jgi:hypothetical protein
MPFAQTLPLRQAERSAASPAAKARGGTDGGVSAVPRRSFVPARAGERSASPREPECPTLLSLCQHAQPGDALGGAKVPRLRRVSSAPLPACDPLPPRTSHCPAFRLKIKTFSDSRPGAGVELSLAGRALPPRLPGLSGRYPPTPLLPSRTSGQPWPREPMASPGRRPLTFVRALDAER